MEKWVAQKRGKYRGRIGLVIGTEPGSLGRSNFSIVQFGGSSGPIKKLRDTSIRPADETEVANYFPVFEIIEFR